MKLVEGLLCLLKHGSHSLYGSHVSWCDLDGCMPLHPLYAVATARKAEYSTIVRLKL